MQTHTDSPAFSVVIPTYNRAQVVQRAIRSVLAQDFHDFEVIVVDDASSDDTAAVVTGMGDPRIRLLRQATNGGVSRARNDGVAAARGEFVAFLDSDDAWLPQMLGKLDRASRPKSGSPVDLIYTYYYKYHVRSGTVGVPLHLAPIEGDIFNDLLSGYWLLTSTMLVRRSAFLELGGFDPSINHLEDYDFSLRLASTSRRVAVVPEPLTVQWDHDDDRLTLEGAKMLRGFRVVEERWGPIVRSRLGNAGYKRWVAGHATHWMYDAVLEAVARGDRASALRHCLDLARCVPAGDTSKTLASALAYLILGHRANRALRRRPAGSQGVPHPPHDSKWRVDEAEPGSASAHLPLLPQEVLDAIRESNGGREAL